MAEPRLVVGAPVHERGWILREWFEALANQDSIKPNEIHILLNYGKGTDDTLDIIEAERESGRWAEVEVLIDSGDDHVARRDWNMDRFSTMTRLRNVLLRHVRELQPEYYLSCDTDILLPPESFRMLVDNFGSYDGIAPLTYMTPTGVDIHNSLDRGCITRPALTSQTTQVFACFGAVLMRPRLYGSARYQSHPQGEDLGWAHQVEVNHLTLAVCPMVKAKHVMNRSMKDVVDPRIGF